MGGHALQAAFLTAADGDFAALYFFDPLHWPRIDAFLSGDFAATGVKLEIVPRSEFKIGIWPWPDITNAP